MGVSLAYRKRFWLHNPFPCERVGEDSAFSFRAANSKDLAMVEGDDRIIARIHAGNTSQRTEEEMAKHPKQWDRVL